MSVDVKWKRVCHETNRLSAWFSGALVTTLAFGFLHFGVVAGWRKTVTCFICVGIYV